MKRPDHKNIINQTVWHAAAIMTDKVEEIRMIADQFAKYQTEGGNAQASLLREQAKRIEAAVSVMDEFGGSWA